MGLPGQRDRCQPGQTDPVAGYRALVVSVLAHAAALAAIARWLDGKEPGAWDRAPRGDGDRDPIAIELVPAAPAQHLEVAIVPDEAIDAAADAVAAADAASLPGGERGRARVAAGGSGGAETAVGPGRGGDAPGHPSLLAMRGLRHDLSLSGDALSRILKDRPLPEQVRPTGLIRPNGREGRIDDPVASYVVHGDGTVAIQDKKDIDIHWRIPLPTPGRILRAAHDLGVGLSEWAEDPYAGSRVGTIQDLPRHLQATPESCQSLNDPMCDAEAPPKVNKGMSGDATIIGILGGRLDLTSYLHRKKIGDPYAARKMRMLDATRAERVETGAAHRAAQLERSAELMARNLEALWRATADPAARREALFELWDECAEGDGPQGAAGERSRAMVIGWIGTHLPKGQPGAYSADDLARLDAKRSSKQHFAPY